MAITVGYHFSVQQLWVTSDLLGQRLAVTVEGRQCLLTLPLDESSFGVLPDDNDHPMFGGWVGTAERPRQKAGVMMVRVDVPLDSDVTADSFERAAADSLEGAAKPVVEELQLVLQQGADIARRVVGSLVEWVRIAGGHAWMGPQYRQPEVTWLTDVRDAEGNRIRMGYHDPVLVWGPGFPVPAVTATGMQGLLEKVAADERPALADELLADAKFYAHGPAPPSPRVGTLLAAVACEVRIKAVLTSRGTAEQAALVDLVLSNPRDVFDKGLQAVMGRSYRVDQREDYKGPGVAVHAPELGGTQSEGFRPG